MGYCMLIRTYFIDHVLHIINFMETLYIYYVFPDAVVTMYLACGTFSELVFNYLSAWEKASFYQLKKNIFRSIIPMKQCFDFYLTNIISFYMIS